MTPTRPPKDQQRPPSPEQAASPPLGDRYGQTVDRDWIVSSLMEVQREIGGHTEKLTHISTDVTSLKNSVGRMEKVLYAAAAVITIVGGGIIWALNAAKDLYIATHSAPPAQVAPAPAAAPTLQQLPVAPAAAPPGQH